MLPPLLFDAVTLRHFGSVEQLELLERLLRDRPGPYWTDTVRSEILAGIGRNDCDNVLAASFLGQPLLAEASDHLSIVKMQIALAGTQEASDAHLGEAESIYFADKLDGQFATDDNLAYDLARRRLGTNRVCDTVELLRSAVHSGILDPSEAQNVANAIRNVGRRLRREHPQTFPPNYFE